jgi:hypothetical protein
MTVRQTLMSGLVKKYDEAVRRWRKHTRNTLPGAVRQYEPLAKGLHCGVLNSAAAVLKFISAATWASLVAANLRYAQLPRACSQALTQEIPGLWAAYGQVYNFWNRVESIT